MEANTETPAKPRRRWFRFSLQTLLIVVTVLGVFFGWLGSGLQRARKNRVRVAVVAEVVEKAVVAIEELGGSCSGRQFKQLRPPTWLEKQFDDPGGPDDPVHVLHVNDVIFPGRYTRGARETTDADLKHLKGLQSVRHLGISYTKVSGPGLEHLQGLNDLRWLDLSGSQVTDSDLGYLKGLTRLEKLALIYNKVTGPGLEHLNGLEGLRWLNLNDNAITDASLEHLKGMTNLEDLLLSGNPITDTGLEHLSGLTGLQSLGVVRTKVTDEGVRKLQQALPNCEISH